MLTKDVSAEVEAVLTKLQQEGKDPTMALVKARLSCKVPIPALISIIKSWKATQRVPKVEIAAKDNSELKLTQRMAQLEQQIEQLLQRVSQLEKDHG